MNDEEFDIMIWQPTAIRIVPINSMLLTRPWATKPEDRIAWDGDTLLVAFPEHGIALRLDRVKE